MNEKMKKVLTEARNKAEDTVVKALNFIEKHPVACTIGGIAASGIVAGAIGKKVGYSNGFDAGYDEGQKEIENSTSMVYWNDDRTEFTIKDPSGEEVTFIKDLMNE